MCFRFGVFDVVKFYVVCLKKNILHCVTYRIRKYRATCLVVGTGVFQIVVTCDLSSRVRDTGNLFSDDHTSHVRNIKVFYKSALLLLLSVVCITCKFVCVVLCY